MACPIHSRVKVFGAAAVDLKPPYNPSVGVNKLMVVLPTVQGLEVAAARIVVGLSLGKAAVPAVLPLAHWKGAGPFEQKNPVPSRDQ